MTHIADVSEFEKVLTRPFRNRALLEQSFIHRSYLNEAEEDTPLSDNERLEFLGDSVLSVVVSELLYLRFPAQQEGDLTGIRSALVRQETLSLFAERLRMGEFLRLGRGEETSGGRTRPVTLCATFEAVVGAIYLDRGMRAVKAFLLPLIESELGHIEAANLSKDAKSRLQEWAQTTVGATPRYKAVREIGPDHAKVFIMQVSIAGTACGVGKGRSKQTAAQEAAAMGLFRLRQDAPEYLPNAELEEEWPLPEVTLDDLVA